MLNLSAPDTCFNNTCYVAAADPWIRRNFAKVAHLQPMISFNLSGRFFDSPYIWQGLDVGAFNFIPKNAKYYFIHSTRVHLLKKHIPGITEDRYRLFEMIRPRNPGMVGFASPFKTPKGTLIVPGQNSIFIAIQIAQFLGYKRVVLLGVSYTELGKRHPYKRHKRILAAMEASLLKKRQAQLLNATPGAEEFVTTVDLELELYQYAKKSGNL